MGGKNRMKRVIKGCLAVMVMFVALSCSPSGEGGGNPGGPDPVIADTGTLTVLIEETVSRAIRPGASMLPASYDIAGIGPEGATFSRTVTGGNTAAIAGLAYGTWTVQVSARNASGVCIGTGLGIADLQATASVSVTVVPHEGTGSLSLSFSWDSSALSSPTVIGMLIPSMGTSLPLEIAVDGVAGAARCVADDIPTGYYTVAVRLLDSCAPVLGAAEVVRIVKDQVTSGSFSFGSLAGAGMPSVEISPEESDPLAVSIVGALAEKPQDADMSLSANVAGYAGSAIYAWYVNGVAVGSGQTYRFHEGWPQGTYHIDAIAVSADGKLAGSATATVQVIAPVAPHKTFVTVWSTDTVGVSGRNQISLPLVADGTYDCVVHWGDGTTSFITSYDDPDKTHTYPAVGSYKVTITGAINGFSFYSQVEASDHYGYYYGDSRKLVDLSSWGQLKLGNSGGYFTMCRNLRISAADVPDLNGTTNLSSMFSGCTAMQFISNVDRWDVSQVTNMSYMFNWAEQFNQDLASWDVSSVADMSFMFWEAMAFNGNISRWDVSSVTNMSGMLGCTRFNRDIGEWNVSNVRDMSLLFYGLGDFNSDIRSWDVSKVTNMEQMFRMNYAFNQDIGSWDVSNVTNMFGVFLGANSFNQDLRSWNVSKVTDMTGMFNGSSLSTTNYSAFLIGMSNLPSLQRDVAFGANAIKYTAASAAARAKLVTDYGWTITDGGQE